MLDDCVALVGLERLGSLHLNDSQKPLGSNVDRHANIGEGELGEDGCAVFLSEPRFEGLPLVLETPGPEHSGPRAEEIALTRGLRERGLAARATADRSARPAPPPAVPASGTAHLLTNAVAARPERFRRSSGRIRQPPHSPGGRS